HLTSAGNTYLFPGIGSGPKNQAFFGTQISRTVRALTGLRVHPHLFRHIAAKLYLDDNPAGYEVVRPLLGHRSTDPPTAFYTGLETAAAVRHFDKQILRLRRENTVEGRKRTRRIRRNKPTRGEK